MAWRRAKRFRTSGISRRMDSLAYNEVRHAGCRSPDKRHNPLRILPAPPRGPQAMSDSAPSKKRNWCRFQFSLRTLVCVILGYTILWGLTASWGVSTVKNERFEWLQREMRTQKRGLLSWVNEIQQAGNDLRLIVPDDQFYVVTISSPC